MDTHTHQTHTHTHTNTHNAGTLKMWVYSGDQDDVCPTLSTRAWVGRLGLRVARPWSLFKSWNGQARAARQP